MQLSAEQVRAARALLDWSQADLVARTKLSARTIKRLEAGGEVTPAVDQMIRQAFESEGVIFIFELSGDASVIGAALKPKA
jgi:transcriptional regulator with XRE-family HTH domain